MARSSLSPALPLVDTVRAACARVARAARHVEIDQAGLAAYADALSAGDPGPPDPDVHHLAGEPEELAAYFLTLDAINFGSGWFPTLRKRDGMSGYETIAAGLRDRFQAQGPWPAAQLVEIDARETADVLGQDSDHELMHLFCESLRSLGARIADEYDGRYLEVVERAQGSAVALVEDVAGWPYFFDVSDYGGEPVPFYKRAQLLASDLALSGVGQLGGLERLTIFADNVVPHVLRVDGVLRYDDALAARVDGEQLLVHGSEEEVEIRACAVHAVELIVDRRADLTAQRVDQALWRRGREPRYKDRPRHRARCIAY